MGRFTENTDWLTLLYIILLSGFGLFLHLTIDRTMFTQQLLFTVAAALLVLFVSRVDWILIYWFAPLGYILSLVLLTVTYLGPSIRGSTRWILIGGNQLQPSEIVKPFLLLFFSWLIVRYPPKKLNAILIHIGLFLLPFILVFRQPDLGTCIVYVSMWLAMMMAGGMSFRLIILTVISGLIITPFVWQLLAPYQKARITSFAYPALDPKGAGYNALQATIAVGSGQWFGRGLGHGTQSHLRFLPEYHTDFIFATLVEELGFVGGIMLLTCYFLLLWRIISRLWKWYGNSFGFMYTIGLFAMLLTQIFINTGMNMGILPITGITLPFVSYGGSSILSFSICFGLYWSLSPRREDADSVAIS